MGLFKDDMVEETTRGKDTAQINVNVVRDLVLKRLEAHFGDLTELAGRLKIEPRILEKAVNSLAANIATEALRVATKNGQPNNAKAIEANVDDIVKRVDDYLAKTFSSSDTRSIKALFQLFNHDPVFVTALVANTAEFKELVHGDQNHIVNNLNSLADIVDHGKDASVVVALAKLYHNNDDFQEMFSNDSDKISRLLDSVGIAGLKQIFENQFLVGIIAKISIADMGHEFIDQIKKDGGLAELERIARLTGALPEKNAYEFYNNPGKLYAKFLRVVTTLEAGGIEFAPSEEEKKEQKLTLDFRALLKQPSFAKALFDSPTQFAERFALVEQTFAAVFGKFAKGIEFGEDSRYTDGTGHSHYNSNDFRMHTNMLLTSFLENPQMAAVLMSGDKNAIKAMLTKATDFVTKLATSEPLKSQYYAHTPLAYEKAMTFVAYGGDGLRLVAAYCTGETTALADAQGALGGATTARAREQR